MMTHTPFAIVSPERAEATNNNERVAEAEAWLRVNNVPTKWVNGVFDNESERAILTTDIGFAKLLGIYYQQDCILQVDANQQAHVVNPRTGESEHVGRWQAVENAEGLTAYTHDPQDDRIYTTV